PHQELHEYLAAPLDDFTEDVIRWWGFHQSSYPTLAKIARDYLAIQGSSVPAEHAFSSAGLTDTVQHNRLSPETFGALQLVKSGYKNGWIKASEETAGLEQHILV
ncbi:hypothetical protein AX14_009480, partial [Amanita brunnescens Koide BX004]